jgi:hypothetical protein
VPERRKNDEFLNAQHLLNMFGVGKHQQQSVIQLLPAAVIFTNALDNMKTT